MCTSIYINKLMNNQLFLLNANYICGHGVIYYKYIQLSSAFYKNGAGFDILDDVQIWTETY